MYPQVGEIEGQIKELEQPSTHMETEGDSVLTVSLGSVTGQNDGFIKVYVYFDDLFSYKTPSLPAGTIDLDLEM